MFVGIFVATICVTTILFGCAAQGKSDQVSMSFQDSAKFNKAELTAAGECVKEKFHDFHNCELTKIWYDASRDYPAKYVETAGNCGIPKGTKGKDILYLLSNYNTGAKPDEGLNPNDTYKGWEWILVRDTAGRWRVTGWGYG